MSAGKGSRARNCHSQAFRDGWDRVFGKAKEREKDEFEAILGPPNPNLFGRIWYVDRYKPDKAWHSKPKLAHYSVVFKPQPNTGDSDGLAKAPKPRKSQGKALSGASK